ncbi:arsenate reductase (glutaredoxin) [Hyunsoonleella sp. 2307UL5-6]|uniref:arsenate reductase (glutaredoxin) n=1 Tax=Hyunsoonleella sp. 2307UL5-6 TaxID=3384768 RepID=UPI0039BD29E8
MIEIYHNNRCRKSREGLELLEKSGKKFKIVKYLEEIPSKEELKKIIALLGIKPIDLVRRTEAIWKSDFKGKDLNDEAIITAMVNNPKLIERPIVINENKAVIGRPPSQILDII